MSNTQFLVLHKTLYRESDLLLSGLSPDFGKLDLIHYRGEKQSAKDFPVAELYRELEIEFDPERGGESKLRTLQHATLLHEFDRIGDVLRHFKFAGAVSRFLLKNCVPDLPAPYTYDAFRQILFDLTLDTPKWTLTECSVLFKLTFLYENGLLPENIGGGGDDFFETLIAAAMEGETLPPAAGDYYTRLNQWLDSLLVCNQLSK